MGVRARRRTTAGLRRSEGRGGAPPSASSMLGWSLCQGMAVPGEEKGGSLDGRGLGAAAGGEEGQLFAVVRLGLCICKRVLDMGWIS